MNVVIIQPSKYVDPTGKTKEGDNFEYTFPAYDQDYTITLSYGQASSGDSSYSGLATPIYKVAHNSDLIDRREYKWSALTEQQITDFILFIKRFNNSYQPFTLTYNNETETFIIDKEPVIDKDRLNLYSITLSLIKYNS